MADYTPTYPNTTKVETLTSELSSDDMKHDTTMYY
jgi:hypothetical protein